MAALVKLSSPGPVFYSQERYGLGGTRFRILKFRKMAATVRGGERLTGRHDFRMTPLGRVLERTKLDELPQLLNVLRGEMSLVGPRPEDPALADHYPEPFARILATPPGLVGPNQLLHRNESELYPPDCSDREAYYLREILPGKIAVDLDYVTRRSFLRDLLLLLRAIPVVAFGLLPLATVRRQPKILLHLLMVPFLVVASLTGSFLLHFDFALPPEERASYLFLLAVLVPVQSACFFAFSTHQVVAKYFNVLDLKQILRVSFVGTGIALVASLAVQFTSHSRAVLVLHAFFLVVLGVFWMSLFRQLPHWWGRVRTDVFRRVRITAVYAVLGAAAFLLAYLIRFQTERIVDLALWKVLLGVGLINGLVFFALQGFNSLNRIISFSHHYELLKVALASSVAIYAASFLLDIERGYPRSLFLMELILKYALALMLKFGLARHYHRPTRPRGARPLRTLLVGNLDEIDRFFQAPPTELIPASQLVGIVLSQGYHGGMSMHSLPVLAPLERLDDVSVQLRVERLLLLDGSLEAALRDRPLGAERVVQEP